MNSRKNRQLTLEEQEQERLRLRRKEWHIQQELERKHKERKLKIIEEYERKRNETMKINSKQKFLWRSKSSSPQRRETSSADYSKEWKSSVIVNDLKDVLNDKKELHKIKISIYNESNLPTKDQNISKEIKRDIIDPNDVILPRRQNEGVYPIFKRNEIKTEEIRTITFSQDKQLVSENQLSTNKKNISTCRRSLDDNIVQHYCDSSSPSHYKFTTHRDDRPDDDDRYNRDRRRSSSIRDSKERDRTERRNRSFSRYSSRTSFRDQSRSRYRSRSHSPTSEQARKRRIDNESKFSSKRNHPDQSRELVNRTSSKSFANYSSSNSFYNPYTRLPRPMPMPMPMPMPRPTMFMPVPGVFPAPFPPINIYQWQRSLPRFVNDRGIGTHTNRYNTRKHI